MSTVWEREEAEDIGEELEFAEDPADSDQSYLQSDNLDFVNGSSKIKYLTPLMSDILCSIWALGKNVKIPDIKRSVNTHRRCVIGAVPITNMDLHRAIKRMSGKGLINVTSIQFCAHRYEINAAIPQEKVIMAYLDRITNRLAGVKMSDVLTEKECEDILKRLIDHGATVRARNEDPVS